MWFLIVRWRTFFSLLFLFVWCSIITCFLLFSASDFWHFVPTVIFNAKCLLIEYEIFHSSTQKLSRVFSCAKIFWCLFMLFVFLFLTMTMILLVHCSMLLLLANSMAMAWSCLSCSTTNGRLKMLQHSNVVVVSFV